MVRYWKEWDLIPEIPNFTAFDYSVEKRNEIIDRALELELSVMIRPKQGIDGETMVIYVNNESFTQS